jgi:ubiquinone/menaquinone biosynthesis C-methylase UbiE
VKANNFEHYLPMMKEKGITVSPGEFHRILNVVYHNFESRVYDELHQPMWDSLPLQFELLNADLIQQKGELPDDLIAIDVGCGTGLGSELLLRTSLGKKIVELDLLDSSPEMLAICDKRASSWGIRHRLINETIENLPSNTYNLVLVCSVLQHIPDLYFFLDQIARISREGGIFLHLQDPNGDFLADKGLTSRIEELKKESRANLPSWLERLTVSRITKRLWRELTQTQPKSYIDLVNKELLSLGIIQKALTAKEMWSVTDFHESDLPFASGKGISIKELRKCMKNYTPVSLRSYGFFGLLWSELPSPFKDREQDLIRSRDINGRYIGGIWQAENAKHR